jgi:aryl-alcohol dehydrogenase-like predicted oxidoreductase
LKETIVGENAKEKIEKAKKLTKLAKDSGTTLPLLALCWCLKNKNVSTVIMGASKSSQLKENLRAAEETEKLGDAIFEEVEKIVDNQPKQPAY